MNIEFDVDFEDSEFPPVKVPDGGNLSEHLHACNSMILFGCRSGVCGTCVLEVVQGDIAPPNREEIEALKIYAPNIPRARLACQIDVKGSIKLKKL